MGRGVEFKQEGIAGMMAAAAMAAGGGTDGYAYKATASGEFYRPKCCSGMLMR